MKAIGPRYSHVVFDWNGTVIDDLDLAVQSVNRVRSAVGLTDIEHSTYRHLFRFPIADFYRDLGFDFSSKPFDLLVADYLRHFDALVSECAVCEGFHELAQLFREAGSKLAILSASHQGTLERTAKRLQITEMVEHLFGLEDNAAASKIARARELDQRMQREPGAQVLMIGDTDHDYAVAIDRDWDFIAVANGHQSRVRLESLGVPVFNQMTDVVRFVALHGPDACSFCSEEMRGQRSGSKVV